MAHAGQVALGADHRYATSLGYPLRFGITFTQPSAGGQPSGAGAERNLIEFLTAGRDNAAGNILMRYPGGIRKPTIDRASLLTA